MWVGKSFINLFSPDPKKMNQLYDSQPESSKFQSDLLPFKMETLTSASGCILGKAFLDLKDDWYSVPIYRYYIKLLRFEWKGHLWVDEFNALTNGLADTPRVVLGYSSQYLQLSGKQDTFYCIDDSLLIRYSEWECIANVTESFVAISYADCIVNPPGIILLAKTIFSN